MNPEAIKFHIHTFGCQMNENDSERIAGMLLTKGAEISPSFEESDLIIINTCAVREKSEEKLYSLLGRLESLKKSTGVRIAVVGCVAQLHGSRLLEKKPFIDFIAGPHSYHEIFHILSDNRPQKAIATSFHQRWHEFSPSPAGRESHISAFVTIMEGCNNFCSYCVVPFIRGREKCRPLKNIIREAGELALAGYKEIQLLGQNVNSYQDPDEGKCFSDLLREVNRIEGIERIRFITSHPKNFNSDIAQAMKECTKVCHQLHLPAQSGSNSILKDMNRGYTREQYLEKISLLRQLMPDISLSTDIIVGFPGEKEKDYHDTLKLLEEVRFTNIFSFCYSPRPLTAASKRKEKVSLAEKKGRLIKLQRFQKNLQMEINKTFLNKIIPVLCHGKSKKDTGFYSGRNEGFQVVNFKSNNDVTGHFVDVRITSCGPYSLRGEAVC